MKRGCQKFSSSEVERHVRSCGAGETQPAAFALVWDAEMQRGRQGIGLSLDLAARKLGKILFYYSLICKSIPIN